MARLSIGQKAERVLKLLLGMRNPRVFAALARHGFSEKDVAEGWRLLQALARGRLRPRRPAQEDPEAVARLDAWENRWFPVASVSLKGRFPAVHAWLFSNLAQTTGVGVVISVGTFLERIAQLVEESSLAGQGAEALALLTQRGLDAQVIAEGRSLLDALGTTTTDVAFDSAPEEDPAAEDDMWQWYREWAGIARVAIRDRQLLRTLGFLSVKRVSGAPTNEDEPVAS